MPRLTRCALLASVLAIACAHDSSATGDGPEGHAVVEAVDALFAAMAAHDGPALRALFLEGAVIVHVGERTDGTLQHRVVSVEEFVTSTEDVKQDLLERFTGPPQVRVDGSLATVWGPYELLVDGERHHCGVNALQLVRLDGRWKATAITYTARPCG